MAVGKRLSTDEPLTEHDVADRIDKAASRLLRIFWDVRQIGGDLAPAVVRSRYLTAGCLDELAAELRRWGADPDRAWTVRHDSGGIPDRVGGTVPTQASDERSTIVEQQPQGQAVEQQPQGEGVGDGGQVKDPALDPGGETVEGQRAGDEPTTSTADDVDTTVSQEQALTGEVPGTGGNYGVTTEDGGQPVPATPENATTPLQQAVDRGTAVTPTGDDLPVEETSYESDLG